MRDVLTFGEALVCFFPASGPRLERSPGGAELNVATGLARLGRSVTYATRVGDDPFGEAIRARLAELGIEAVVEVDPERRTGVYFREVASGTGRRVFYYRTGSAASALGAELLPPLGGFRIVHATGITAALGPRPLAAVEAASHAPAFTLDVNFRPALWSAPRCREALLPVAARAELVFVSEEDAVAVAPGDALAAGAKAVVRTLGPAGAEYLGADGTRAEAAPPHVEAVDTVGAGDAFVAGYLDAWLRGSGPAEALAAGCRLGAEAVSRVGDS